MAAGEPVPVLLSWLGTYLVHSTFVLLTAWVFLRGRSSRRPRLAERTWRFALLAGLISASLQVFTGTRPVFGSLSLDTGASPGRSASPSGAVREISRQESTPALLVESPAQEVADPKTRRVEPDALLPRANEHHGTEAPMRTAPVATILAEGDPSIGAPMVPAAPARTTAPIEGKPLSSRLLATLESSLVVAWGLATLLGLGLFGCAWVRLRGQLHRRRRIESGPILDQLREIQRRARTSRPVRLSLSHRTDSPITIGWFRPEIVLPERALASLSTRQIESMLAHELAHAARRDPIWFSIYALCERSLFFQPLNRLARSELHGVAELLCDDWAVRWTGQRLALASCLAEVAQWIVGTRRLAVPAMAGQPSRLCVRIERLLDDRRSPPPEGSAHEFVLVFPLALALCIFAVPGVSSAAASRMRPGPRASLDPAPQEPAERPARSAPNALPEALTPERGATSELQHDHAQLNEELSELEHEIEDLSAELVELGLAERFGCAVEELQAKLASLRAQHERLSALLDRAFPLGTPHGSHDVEPILERKSP